MFLLKLIFLCITIVCANSSAHGSFGYAALSAPIFPPTAHFLNTGFIPPAPVIGAAPLPPPPPPLPISFAAAPPPPFLPAPIPFAQPAALPFAPPPVFRATLPFAAPLPIAPPVLPASIPFAAPLPVPVSPAVLPAPLPFALPQIPIVKSLVPGVLTKTHHTVTVAQPIGHLVKPIPHAHLHSHHGHIKHLIL